MFCKGDTVGFYDYYTDKEVKYFIRKSPGPDYDEKDEYALLKKNKDIREGNFYTYSYKRVLNMRGWSSRMILTEKTLKWDY